jgi:hypothetical protein
VGFDDRRRAPSKSLEQGAALCFNLPDHQPSLQESAMQQQPAIGPGDPARRRFDANEPPSNRFPTG